MRYERQKSHFVADYLDVLNIDYFSAKWRKVCKMLLKRWCDTAFLTTFLAGMPKRGEKSDGGGGLPEKGKKILEQRGMRFALSYCMRVQTKVYLYQQALSHLLRKWPRGDIAILESLVGEGRLRAVRFFGNLAADGTLFCFARRLVFIHLGSEKTMQRTLRNITF